MMLLNECLLCCCLFRYRLRPETFGYTLVYSNPEIPKLLIKSESMFYASGYKYRHT